MDQQQCPSINLMTQSCETKIGLSEAFHSVEGTPKLKNYYIRNNVLSMSSSTGFLSFKSKISTPKSSKISISGVKSMRNISQSSTQIQQSTNSNRRMSTSTLSIRQKSKTDQQMLHSSMFTTKFKKLDQSNWNKDDNQSNNNNSEMNSSLTIKPELRKADLNLRICLKNGRKESTAIYDESPAKMKSMRECQKNLQSKLQECGGILSLTQLPYFDSLSELDHLLGPNYNLDQQKNLKSSTPKNNLECIEETKKEDILSCEKSPHLNDLISPASPNPNCLKTFNDPRKKSSCFFDFKDSKLFSEDVIKINPQIKFNSNYKKLEKIIQINNHYKEENTLSIDILKSTLTSKVLPRKMGIVQQTFNHNNLNKFNVIDEQNNSTNAKPKKQYKLNLQNQNISWRYKEVISTALKHKELDELQSLNLSNNNITGETLKVISANIPKSIKKINLSQNNVQQDIEVGMTLLFNSKHFPKLIKINLENNNITNLGLSLLIDAFVNNRSLQILNLSHNKLTDGCGDVFRKYLKYTSDLQELYLHWNKISTQGALALAEGLQLNYSLQILDLSHNGLGMLKKLKCGLAILKSCSVIGTAMRHLDLSYNMFQQEECLEISEFLSSKNSTLYGIHFQGNQNWGIFNARGFLKPLEKEQQEAMCETKQLAGMLKKRRIKGYKVQKCQRQKQQNNLQRDICWICDGWQEMKFEVKSGCSDSFLGGPVFLHLDFDDFQPHKMEEDIESDIFFLYRMCPPNSKVTFFFSDPTQPTLFYSKHYPYKIFKNDDFEKVFKICQEEDVTSCTQETTIPNNTINFNATVNSINSINLHSTSIPTPPNFKIFRKQTSTRSSIQQHFLINYQNPVNKQINAVQYLKPSLINCIEITTQSPIIHSEDGYILVSAKPREGNGFFVDPGKNWIREISLFRNYVQDTQEILDKCFEMDWKNGRLEKVLTLFGDVSKSKNLLKSQYKKIRNIYKYMATVGIAGDIPCISYNQYSSFLQNTKITDNKLLKSSDSDIIFVTCNNSAGSNAVQNQVSSLLQKEQKNHRNPEKALVRHEFLELLARLALEKYQKNNVVETASDAIQIFFKEKDLQERLNQINDPQEWRNNRYWNQKCDEVMKKYLGFLKILWEGWADSKKTEKRGFQNFKSMSVFEFCDMARFYDLLDDQLSERELLLSYNMAMMTQEDEVNNDKCIQMNFVEFLEGIARLAERKLTKQQKQLLNSVMSTKAIQNNNEEAEDSSIKKSYHGVLYQKLESMLEEMQVKYDNLQFEKRTQEKKTQQFIIKKPIKIMTPPPLVPCIQLSRATLEEIESSLNNQQIQSSFNPYLLSPLPFLKQRSKTPEEHPPIERELSAKEIKDMFTSSLGEINEADLA